jgi:alpha-galactosidase
MPKIAFIGSGSLVFTRNLCNDILLTPSLEGSTIALMDVDPKRLEQSQQIVQARIDQHQSKTTLVATLEQKEAVRQADYVITTFQQGGLEAYRLDIEIPERYGVGQCVGDTLGPGGVFRALRTIPVLTNLALDLAELAPEALLLNYVNPMAANCWAVDAATGQAQIGLCHSVQGTSEMLARWINAPYDRVSFLCAGINHQAFFLEFREGNEDLYPRIWQAIQDPEILGSEPVRIELMKHFGYFVTESSGHASEYVPYFRKSSQMISDQLVPKFRSEADHWFDFGRTGGHLRHCLERQSLFDQEFADIRSAKPVLQRSHEYGSYIIEAIETNVPIRVNGNVSNLGLIDNLPHGCCVEVPCLIDSNGVQPTVVGSLPPQLAGLNRTNINVQELIIEAALTGNREAVYHAVMLDPLTASVCTLDQIRRMVDDLFAVQKRWLPQFA